MADMDIGIPGFGQTDIRNSYVGVVSHRGFPEYSSNPSQTTLL